MTQQLTHPDPEVRGTGTYAPPPREQAVETVRRELAAATSEGRREELREVLRTLDGGEGQEVRMPCH